jgi:hypothetical protein
MPFESYDLQGHDDDSDFKNAYAAYIQMNSSFDDSFIKSKEKKKKEKDQQSLENFFDATKIDDDNNPPSSDEIKHD